VQYAQFWQNKLKDNKDVEFPDKLCPKIAEITDKFSFAATLLAIAVRGEKAELLVMRENHRWAGPDDPMTQVDKQARCERNYGPSSGDDDVDKLELWVEMKKQVKILKDEMDEKSRASTLSMNLPIRPRVGVDSLTRYRDELDVLLHGRRSDHESSMSRPGQF
jgi:transitional endoplasmic reticulum ATPase